jgi:hypothetical protein
LICPTCIKVVGTGGYCDACHAGFIGRKAYFSKLTYLLARGAPLDPLKLTCETCRKNAKSHGWCDKCRFGLVGNNRFDDHKLFDEAAAQFDRLLAAIELADRCETCPSAMMVDAKCPNCRIDYRDGKPVPAPQSQSDNP